jgi:hypothetical protein
VPGMQPALYAFGFRVQMPKRPEGESIDQSNAEATIKRVLQAAA